MKNIYWCIEFLVSFIEIFVSFQVLLLCFKPVYEKRKQGIIVCCFAVSITGLVELFNYFHLFSFIILPFAIGVITISAFHIFKARLIEILSLVSFYFLIIYLLDFLAISIVGILLNESDYGNIITTQLGIERVIYIVSMKVLLIGIYFLLKKHISILKQSELARHIYYLFIISIIGFIGMYSFSSFILDLKNKNIIIDWFSFLIIIGMLIILFVIFAKYKERERENELIFLHSNLIEETYKDLKTKYDNEMKRLHDFNHHLEILYYLSKKDELDKLKEYISELYDNRRETFFSMYSGNEILDVILNQKLEMANRYNIKMNIGAGVPNSISITPADLCTIVSNILDNAIEACKYVEQNRWINTSINVIGKMLIIKVQNNYKYEPLCDTDKRTLKSDYKHHGIGLKSVKLTVSKYDGFIDYKWGNYVFEIVAMLPI